MKNAFLIAFLAFLLFGGCEKEVAVATDDGQVFCPVRFRMDDLLATDPTCASLAPGLDETAGFVTEPTGVSVAKRLFHDARLTIFANGATDPTKNHRADNWLDGSFNGGGNVSFEKFEIDTGARFGLFFGSTTVNSDGSTETAPSFGDPTDSKFQVWVSRAADGSYALSARGGGVDSTIAGLPDFFRGAFQIYLENQNIQLSAQLTDASGITVGAILIDYLPFDSAHLAVGERLAMGFGMELLPDFKSDCAARLCQIRLQGCYFRNQNAETFDDFKCNSIVRN